MNAKLVKAGQEWPVAMGSTYSVTPATAGVTVVVTDVASSAVLVLSGGFFAAIGERISVSADCYVVAVFNLALAGGGGGGGSAAAGVLPIIVSGETVGDMLPGKYYYVDAKSEVVVTGFAAAPSSEVYTSELGVNMGDTAYEVTWPTGALWPSAAGGVAPDLAINTLSSFALRWDGKNILIDKSYEYANVKK